MSISIWDNLPREIWEKILDSLDTHGLQQAQNTCASWREIVLAYIMNGRLGNRALKLDRRRHSESDAPGSLLEHRNCTWDSLLVQVDRPILLTGMGVYAPQGASETIISVDARPFVFPLRPLDVETKLNSEFEDSTNKVIGIFAKVPFVIDSNSLWEMALNISTSRSAFSNRTIWSQSGSYHNRVESNGTYFTFCSSEKSFPWRSSSIDGQFPFLFFWKL
ncbi:uncharacterized protein LOC131887181 isoform X2 [Tigriopus californicus]|uniref:uncharacterized protein LOC131887181 isoform X2 n=1 Tax=Tigriopus californicus TaxID=6832 RepID=UPI0027DA2461|nr:uncharacterized protein LOC131887181 isoform X2 [Tigriopus californicus]